MEATKTGVWAGSSVPWVQAHDVRPAMRDSDRVLAIAQAAYTPTRRTVPPARPGLQHLPGELQNMTVWEHERDRLQREFALGEYTHGHRVVDGDFYTLIQDHEFLFQLLQWHPEYWHRLPLEVRFNPDVVLATFASLMNKLQYSSDPSHVYFPIGILNHVPRERFTRETALYLAQTVKDVLFYLPRVFRNDREIALAAARFSPESWRWVPLMFRVDRRFWFDLLVNNPHADQILASVRPQFADSLRRQYPHGFVSPLLEHAH